MRRLLCWLGLHEWTIGVRLEAFNVLACASCPVTCRDYSKQEHVLASDPPATPEPGSGEKP